MGAVVGAAAMSRIVLEERLSGPEVSLIVFCDGRNFAAMPPVRDHKRIFDGDRGPNTGGMGTVCDDSLLSAEDLRQVTAEVIRPTLDGCADEGFPFKGILFIGLMMTESGPKVLEYNVRFGDPETQVILSRLETPLTEVCGAMLSGTLDGLSSACVILAAEGYPSIPRKGDLIKGLDDAAGAANVEVFHAGTAKNDHDDFVTSGGRVLGVTAVGDDLDSAIDSAYSGVAKISWDGMQFRRDIGRR
jgi:phosphoribosylamine--glycine ligase